MREREQLIRRRGLVDDVGRVLELVHLPDEVVEAEVEAAETKKMLGGEHDRASAVVTIHPGAGGTESQDWAEMLYRMYVRYAERRGWEVEVTDALSAVARLKSLLSPRKRRGRRKALPTLSMLRSS